MDDEHSKHWRQMFDRGRQDRPPDSGNQPPRWSPTHPPTGYDDSYDAARRSAAPMSPQEVVDEAALALAGNSPEYRPWILQRGPRPALMLHLRRFDPKSGMWIGWQVSYHNLVACEYVGDRLLSLDFGMRQFAIEGSGLDELVRNLQQGNVLCVQEYSSQLVPQRPTGPIINKISKLTSEGER